MSWFVIFSLSFHTKSGISEIAVTMSSDGYPVFQALAGPRSAPRTSRHGRRVANSEQSRVQSAV